MINLYSKYDSFVKQGGAELGQAQPQLGLRLANLEI